MRFLAASVLAAALAAAPMQCQSEPPPEQRRYERPEEALYDLAQRFKKRGDSEAWRVTLETIIERYPNSRQAIMAQDDLGQASDS